MKKRLISMALAVSMAVSVVPAPVLAANIGGGGKNPSEPDPIAVQKVISLDGMFQPPQTLTKDTINMSTSTTTVSTAEALKTAVAAGGSIQLQNDIELSEKLIIPANVTVMLNLGGHTLKASDSFTSPRLIEVNGTLVVTNGTLDGNHKTTCVYVGWSGTGPFSFILGAGATIQNGKSDGGAGVFINEGTFIMKDGSRITDCHAEVSRFVTHPGGGAVCVVDNASNTSNTFKMEGGIIENCAATQGGAVRNDAIFTMTGGTIENCSSNTDKDYNRSSAVYNNGAFNADGGEVKGTVHNYKDKNITSSGTGATTFHDTVYNEGTIGGGKFDGTVNNSGAINGGTFKKIETAGNGSIANTVTGYELVQLIDLSDLISKIPTTSGESVSLKLNRIAWDNKIDQPLTIPEGVTVNLDLGEYNLEERKGPGERNIITVNGTLNLTNGTLNIPITNNGTLNADNSVTIAGEMTNAAGASMSGGKFTGAVTNYGTISEGTFTGTVKNENTGEIYGGNFAEGTLVNNGGTVSEKPVAELYDLTVKNAEVTVKDADGKAVEVAKAEDGTLTAKVPEKAEVTVKYTAPTDAIVFDLWRITSEAALDVNTKENPLTFTMPDKAVTIEAMTRDATIEEDGPGVLGTAAMIGVGVAGTAILGYQGYMIGTELYLNTVLPDGAAIPQNYGELAKLLWTEAGMPAPAAVMAADATDEQKALAWAVEQQLIPADKAADASVTRWEVIQSWNKMNG